MSDLQALIIDDNSKNAAILVHLLKDEGVESTALTNPKQVMETLNRLDQLAIVFLDLEMPGLDGYQVLNQIKSDTRFEGVPVIAYTVHVSEIKVAHENGFDGFLGKPIDPEKFPDQLQRILNGESVWETM